MSKPKRVKTSVISPQGRRATKLVGALRFGSALATFGAIIGIGWMFDDGVSTSRAVFTAAFAAAAGVLATAELAVGGRAARAEEPRIRIDILERQYAAATDSSADREEYPPGRVIQMMTDGAERVTEFRQVYFGSTLAAMLIPVAVLILIGVLVNSVVGFVSLALVPVIPLAIGGFMGAFRKTSADSRRQRAGLTVRYLDAIRNLVTIRLLGAGDRVTTELRGEGEKNRGAIMKLLAGNQIVIIVMDGIFSLVLICAVIWLTVSQGPHLSNGDVIVIALSLVLLLEPLQQVAGFFYIGMGGIASQKEIRGYVQHTAGLAITTGSESAASVPDIATGSATISMEDVSFDYGRGAVFTGVDLDVGAGDRVAIMGPSGVGKSTLLALLRGTATPTSGTIRIAGQDLAASSPAEVRSLSATVSQSTWMFTGTIADNLRLAREGASEDDMWRVLRLANVATEVEGMPNGLDTQLGESGALISGGQAQRISLARALLSGRRVLLLDEPTSQVDVESEAHIIDALEALPRDWTILMVTHRPSLLRIADAVYTMHDGTLQSGALQSGTQQPTKEPARV